MRALGLFVVVTSLISAASLGAGSGRELFTLPLECGSSALISQGNGGSFSHGGRAKFAFDFDLPRNTPITAMADGDVVFVRDTTKPGDRCYDGGEADCFPFANLVVIRHGDGSSTIIKHLDSTAVKQGDRVKRGQRIGVSGSTGYSTGPHAHVMRQELCGDMDCTSLPMTFADVPGDGIPKTDDIVKAEPCR